MSRSLPESGEVIVEGRRKTERATPENSAARPHKLRRPAMSSSPAPTTMMEVSLELIGTPFHGA
jgi:hypothetical protein